MRDTGETASAVTELGEDGLEGVEATGTATKGREITVLDGASGSREGGAGEGEDNGGLHGDLHKDKE